MALDAFGRLRISKNKTLFEYYPTKYSNQEYTPNGESARANLDDDIWKTIKSNNGTGPLVSYNAENYINLEIPIGSNNFIFRRTKLPMEYQSGKSRLFYMTFVPVNRLIGNDDETVQIGCYDVNNSGAITEGIWFEIGQNNILSFCIKHKNEAVNKFIQTNWNIDTFNGSGPSGKTINNDSLTKCMLLVIDQEWLGVGRVRFGFNIEGINYYGHQYNPTNAFAYTSTPRLPLCYGIKGTSPSSNISTRQICCTCISEGGYAPLGRRNSISTNVNLQNPSPPSSPPEYILLSLKIKNDYPTGILRLKNINILNTVNDRISTLKIYLMSSNKGNTTLTNSNYTDVPYSITTAYKATDGSKTITSPGYLLYTLDFISRAGFDLSLDDYELYLTRNQVSIYDYLVVSIILSGQNQQNIFAAIDFIETV